MKTHIIIEVETGETVTGESLPGAFFSFKSDLAKWVEEQNKAIYFGTPDPISWDAKVLNTYLEIQD